MNDDSKVISESVVGTRDVKIMTDSQSTGSPVLGLELPVPVFETDWQSTG